MQYKQTLVRLLFLLFPLVTLSQTTYLPRDDKENILIDRLEIKAQTHSVLNFSKDKPFSRKQFIPHISRIDSDLLSSRVDQYNLYSLMADNLEWATGDRSMYLSRKPILKH